MRRRNECGGSTGVVDVVKGRAVSGSARIDVAPTARRHSRPKREEIMSLRLTSGPIAGLVGLLVSTLAFAAPPENGRTFEAPGATL